MTTSLQLKLYFTIKPDGTVRAERLYGRSHLAVLPSFVGGRPLTEGAPYLFSAARDGEPEGETVYLEAEDPFLRPDGDGPVTDGPLSFREWESLPEHFDPEEMKKPICGPELVSVLFPDSVKRLGRYTFYNCDGLRHLRMSADLRDIGGGSFNGCRKVTDLTFRLGADEKSGLRELLTELNETLAVHLFYAEEETERARIVFPEYFEEAIENTPARQLETRVHGCGHRYRYCFHDKAFLFAEYDGLFPWLMEQERASLAAEVAITRLRFPFRLSEEARKRYEGFLAEGSDAIARLWLKEKAVENLKFLALLPGLTEEKLSQMIDLARESGRTEFTGWLMETRHKRFPAQKRRFSF
ncbi:MAG: leucine-rich repeat protein [Lachnospiraceae bacterium]|nr:leucine-rich repeat protein [Lachnospiraceae bacterium]